LDDRRSDDNIFDKSEGTLKGKYVMDMLVGYFELVHNLKIIFKNIPYPSYERYTNLYEVVRNFDKQEYRMGKVWKNMCQFAKI